MTVYKEPLQRKLSSYQNCFQAPISRRTDPREYRRNAGNTEKQVGFLIEWILPNFTFSRHFLCGPVNVLRSGHLQLTGTTLTHHRVQGDCDFRSLLKQTKTSNLISRYSSASNNFIMSLEANNCFLSLVLTESTRMPSKELPRSYANGFQAKTLENSDGMNNGGQFSLGGR